MPSRVGNPGLAFEGWQPIFSQLIDHPFIDYAVSLVGSLADGSFAYIVVPIYRHVKQSRIIKTTSGRG